MLHSEQVQLKQRIFAFVLPDVFFFKKKSPEYKTRGTLIVIRSSNYASTSSAFDAIKRSNSSCEPTRIFSYSRKPVPEGIK